MRVYGPVSMPFTGRVVSDCVHRHQSTVMGPGQRTGPTITGLW